jgi:inositol transport system permease protein
VNKILGIERRQIVKKYGIVFVLFFMIIILGIIRPAFLRPRNIFNVLTQGSIYGILALGVTFVIISKGIDLSLGSMLAFAGVVAASFGQSANAAKKFFPDLPVMPIIVPILAAVLIGSLCGFINGFFVAKTNIPAFIATLGMTTIARGLALIYSKGQPISDMTAGLTALGGNVFGIIPMPGVIYFVFLVISAILLQKTRFGKNCYAIGGNIVAAEVSGVKVKKNIMMIYTYCGFLTGVAAIVFAGRVGSVHPGAATGYELTAIAATTIGGTSQSGGIGTIRGCFIGVMILAILRNGLTLLGVDAYWQQVVEGCVIIGAVVVDMRKNARRA